MTQFITTIQYKTFFWDRVLFCKTSMGFYMACPLMKTKKI